LRTTSFLLDKDILIDAGTGVLDLSVAELKQIDHISSRIPTSTTLSAFPFWWIQWMDEGQANYPARHRRDPDILKQHIFNWLIWPDFNLIPTSDKPFHGLRTTLPWRNH